MDILDKFIKFRKSVEDTFFKNGKPFLTESYAKVNKSVVIKGIKILIDEGLAYLILQYQNRKKYLKKRKEFFNNDITTLHKIIKESLDIGDISEIFLEPPPINPDVSIVIPVSQNIEYTLKCLKSISLRTKGSYEVVVVGDVSTRNVKKVLQNIKNLNYFENDKTIGYVQLCNIGANESRGEYIFFLKSNMIVTENWKEPLLKMMGHPNVGAVGVKIINQDRQLQDAGGIIWDDASKIHYGRGDNPAKPEYNFVRDVDYCSGSALFVKREIFQKVGGFDESFKSASYAAADLCFSIRNIGYRVIFNPNHFVIHYKGKINQIDTISEIKGNKKLDQDKFFKKWNKILIIEHGKYELKSVFSARTRRKGKTILVIDRYVPMFDKDSGSYRMWNLLKILVELGHNVVFVGDDATRYDPYTADLQQSGIEVQYFPYLVSIDKYLENYAIFFEIVMLSRVEIANKYFHLVKHYCMNAKIIFDTVDLQFLRESRRAIIESNEKIHNESEKIKQLELYFIKMSDLTFVVSPTEYEILKKEDSSLNLKILSNIHIIQGCKKSYSERKDILFLGNFEHLPNIDAIQWFLEEIYPLIKSKLPGLIFYIVGNDPLNEMAKFRSKDIVVTGHVRDLEPFFNNCRIFIAPIRYGAGVKGKINQSMSYGLPVVTTPIGAEGMGLVDKKNALISDSPLEFANNVVNLYNDQGLWESLSENSIQNIFDNFSYEKTKVILREIIDGLCVDSS